MPIARKFPIGAEPNSDGVHVRVWAPAARRVTVVFDDGSPCQRLERDRDGYHQGLCSNARPGTRYRLQLDDGEPVPDPVSRFQPEGPAGPSEVIDPNAYRWRDTGWRGCGPRGQVIYELHVGTFTREGTWRAAMERLAGLAELGITLIEVMPVAEFAGRFGWGYDGVDMFAPTRLYGRPEDMKAFVDQAHALGMGVVLDVVYNHFGPDGNYIAKFSPDFFSKRYDNEWGDPLNFDDENSGPVREFFVTNARYWIEEYHLDGLRLDATQSIHDASDKHLVTEIAEACRRSAGERSIVLVAENEPQDSRLVRPIDEGGNGLDMVWNDDFHHSAVVALTGSNEAYYSDHLGTPQELVSACKWGYLFQGQRYAWQKQRRGRPGLDLPAWAFVTFIENHDQVANRGDGSRLHERCSPGRFRAMTALLLLGPGTPMLFQGQEFGASAPFCYFADHKPELAKLVRKGRHAFMRQFPSLAAETSAPLLPIPDDPEVFERCKLDHHERSRNAHVYALHRDLLALRRADPVFSAQSNDRMHGAILGPEAFVLRFFGDDGDDRLLIVNLGRDIRLVPAPEPLLGPPRRGRWGVQWASEDPRYGGRGAPSPETDEGWWLQGHAAVVLHPVALEED